MRLSWLLLREDVDISFVLYSSPHAQHTVFYIQKLNPNVHLYASIPIPLRVSTQEALKSSHTKSLKDQTSSPHYTFYAFLSFCSFSYAATSSFCKCGGAGL
jgi:hypothetical protein